MEKGSHGWRCHEKALRLMRQVDYEGNVDREEEKNKKAGVRFFLFCFPKDGGREGPFPGHGKKGGGKKGGRKEADQSVDASGLIYLTDLPVCMYVLSV